MSAHFPAPIRRITSLGSARRGSATLTKVAMALLAAGAGSAALAVGGSLGGTHGGPGLVVAGDTAFHYGPANHNGSGGVGTTYVEQISISVTPGRVYRLRLVNGNPNGTNRVNRAETKWNGWEVVSWHDFTSGTAELVVPVAATSTDTLHIRVIGSAGSFVSVSVFSVPDPAFNIFGDSVLSIPSGTTQDYNLTLTVPADAASPFRMYVVNGDTSGGQRVTGQWIKINGTTVTQTNDMSTGIGSFTREVSGLGGTDTLKVLLSGSTGAFIRLRITATDTTTPNLTVTSPADSATTSQTSITASGTVSDVTLVAVTANGVTATVTNDTAWTASVPLSTEGWQSMTYIAIDAAGKSRTIVRTIRRDTQAPALTLTSPTAGSATKHPTIAIAGSVTDASPVTANTNGTTLTVTGTAVSGTIALGYGANVLVTTATDQAGNATIVTRTVTRDTLAPVLTVTAPVNNATVTGDSVTVSGTVSDATTVTVTANGITLPVTGGGFSGKVPIDDGSNPIMIVATDLATNTTTAQRTVVRNFTLPPDPATVAPPIDQTIPSTTGRSTAFLYTGSNPIQTGVAGGTIDELRAAVLRGKVLDGAGAALSGVKVTVVGHPEYGQTYSRTDGMFDLAMNGGSPLTLQFTKSGYAPAQRLRTPSWQTFAAIDSVSLVARDTAATVITFTQPIEVARATPVTDADGTRRATLLFAQGTVATMTLPNDSTQVLSQITVRTTEFTAGALGYYRMPADLPPATAYTYAAEWSVDEAVAAQATKVEFDIPVVSYTENFLTIPTGWRAPLGIYDQQLARWIPKPDGRIVKIHAVSGGVVDLDVNGAGVAATSGEYTALGISTAERQTLATLYSVGQTLTRVTTTHFSAPDINYPAHPLAPGSNPPNGSPPPKDPDCEPKASGSIIGCLKQTLGEVLPLAGTPYQLRYTSERTPGYLPARQVRVAAQTILDTTGNPGRLPGRNQFSPTTRKVVYELFVAGKSADRREFSGTTPIPATTLIWDGMDAYNRVVNGPQPAGLEIILEYDQLYANTPSMPGNSFGAPAGSGAVTAGPTRLRDRLGQTIAISLGSWDNRALGLGGWAFDVHHVYDPVGGKLYLGTGDQRTVRAQGQEIRVVPSTKGSFLNIGGTPYSDRAFPDEMAMDAQGRIYIPYYNEGVVRRLDLDDSLRTIVTGVSADGIALAPDGTMYLAGRDGTDQHKVWRYAPGGPLTDFAGTGTPGFGGDGGPATSALLNTPTSVAVGPDGSVYIADMLNHRIRRVDPSGIISTFAGDGNPFEDGNDGGSATSTAVPDPQAVAVASDGAVYFGSYVRLRRVTPNGIIKTIAGKGGSTGTPAERASFWSHVTQISFAPNGDLLLATNPRIFRMTEGGEIAPLAGGLTPLGGGDPVADSVLPLQTRFDRGRGVVMAPDETYYVSDYQRHHIRQVRPALPGYSTTNMLVADAGGQAVFEFDHTGRHLYTRDAVSGDTLLTFGYDGAGRLASITDGSGNVTTIQRNGGTGLPTGVTGPFGQQTTLTTDGNGFLREVSDPAGQKTRLYHRPTGLLDSLVDPRGGKYQFQYDSLGRLVQDDGPSGTSQGLGRTESDTGHVVTRTTALGRQTLYQLAQLENQDQVSRITDPAGFFTTTLRQRDGTTIMTAPDGTSTTMTEGTDPRFGAQAPIMSRMSLRLPSGDSVVVTSARRVALANPNNPFSVTAQYDTMLIAGRLFTTTGTRTGGDWLETVTTPLNRQTITRLDSLGRVRMERQSGLDSVTYAYDGQGRLTQIQDGGRIATYTYDTQGRLKTTTDPLGRTDSLFYDAADRVVRTRAWDGRELTFNYDSTSNLTTLAPPGRPTHQFSYRADGLVTSYAPPSLGSGTWSTAYGYNLDGQLTSLARPTGDTLALSYDSFGRASGVGFSRGVLGGGTLTYAYSGTTGQLTGVAHSAGSSLAFTYDGTLPTQVTWSGPVAGTVSLGYDGALRVDTIRVNSTPIGIGYDDDGLVTAAGALKLSRRADNGLVEADTLGVVTGSWTFDGRAALSNYTASASGTALYQAGYQRDSLGRVTTLTETVQGTTLARAFTYDSAGRLAEVREGGTLVRSYGYDANGNRLSLTGPGLSISGSYDDQDRIVSYGTATYAHDRAGFLTEKVVGTDTTRYTYDALGNLLQVRLSTGTVIEYLVDAQNRRVGKKVGGALQRGWLWQSQLAPAAELDSSGAVVSRFVYATRVNVPDYLVKGGVTYRLVLDQLGSVRLVVNTSNGTVAQRLDYDEFGRVTGNSNPGFQPFGFVGGLYDDQTELVRFGARDYDAVTGRWTAKDPIGFNGGNANQYQYGSGNPTNSIDPTGLKDYDCRETADILRQLRDGIGSDPLNFWKKHNGGGDADYKAIDEASDGIAGNDRYYVNGGWLRSDQFGNFAAGYVGHHAAGLLGLSAVFIGGIYWDRKDARGGRAKFDFDTDSWPMIWAGARFADRESGPFDPATRRRGPGVPLPCSC